jgi:signal transduction histidine kinase
VDSEAEGALDRMTRFAQVVLEAPVALISLVDDHRQFFKSHQGLPEPWASERQTPLTHSFCQHVVTSAQPLIVSDARLDERVRENLAIRDLNVIAYAGYPIVAPGGQVLGSLCAIHGRPHPWTERELLLLRELSEAVSNEVALRLEVLSHKETNRQLRVQKEAAEQASQAKNIFLQRVSHELRTPLNSIIGFSEIIHDEMFGSVNPKQKRYVGNVLSSARHLLDLINTLLDLSAIESNSLKLNLAEADMAVLVRQVCGELESLARKKGQLLDYSKVPAECVLEFDRTRIRQVLTNLVGNAIKYSHEGDTIRVELALDTTKVTVRVADHGPGLTEEEQSRVFDAFYRTESVANLSGAGLGLPISKALVELHNGVLAVESKPSQGSTFSFTIPRKGRE